MKRFLFSICCLLVSFSVFAQSGELSGKITDKDSGEGLPFANVYVTINGLPLGSTTDFDGFYSIKPIPPGTYDLTVEYIGYQTSKTTGVQVIADKITFLDIQVAEESELLDEVVVIEYRTPLFEKDQTSSGSTVSKEDIANLPTRNVESIASTTAGVYQEDEGSDLNVKGARSEGTEYYIDGIRVRGGTGLPANAIEQMSVVTGGIPAKYGDATGGIINITTRGPANGFGGGVEFISSQLTDDYGYNHATFNLTGPLLKLRKGTDTETALMGFFIAGEIIKELDDMPSTFGIYRAKEDVLQNIIDNPLVASGGGFVKSIDFVTLDDLENVPTRENTDKTQLNFTAKFDIKPSSNLNFTLGGSVNYIDGGLQSRSAGFRSFVRRYEPFAWDHTPHLRDFTYRGFARFTQNFATNLEEGEDVPLFSNAFYSLQFDYTRDQTLWEDPIHQDNFFNYGHVGSFTTTLTPSYSQGDVEAINVNSGEQIRLNGRVFNGLGQESVAYEAGTSNPIPAQHTSTYFDLVGGDNADLTQTVQAISANGGLINGERSSSSGAVYSMFYLPGTIWNDYLKTDNDQYRLTFNSSVDIKKPGSSDRNKHAIEFGFEYEQRIDRQYRIAPEGLWDRMRREISKPGLKDIDLDLDNPILVIDGQEIPISIYNEEEYGTFSAFDTITYNYVRSGDGPYVDQQIRERFGYGDLDWVDTDALSPDQLDLSLFSPEDLYGAGNRDNLLTRYYGYDYQGNKLSDQPAFEDFFVRDENGNLTGAIGAFRPVYMAGYIQDKFSFKDLIFNIGVRVDRYDANTKVLKDEYSLYGVRTAGSITELNGNDIAHPTTIGDDFVVYVDDEINPTQIKGYRDGDDWYDANGSFTNDVRVLEDGGNVQPYLSDAIDDVPEDDIQDENFVSKLNTTFEDYTPQITVMPRIAFSFNISDEAVFYANYNVLAQRPQGRNFATPFDYYFFSSRAIDRTFNNPNLRPERTIDYQVGFKQKLSKRSALTISGFYRELRDMIQISQITNAYPVTYRTYRNIDFGTVKGLELSYDLRRTGNVKFVANYTLQFADGTGSSDDSALDLVNNGQGNIRSIFPLNYDARHTFNMNFDYRFKDGSDYNGPKIGKVDLFANAGVNFIARYRSGTPFTQQKDPTPDGQFGVAGRTRLEGTPNGSRLPGAFKLDMKIDKDFQFGGKEGKNPKYINVYVWVQNLLDAENVTNVYGFTGSASDDGYISSALGQVAASNETDAVAFADLYGLRVNNPYNFILPRRIRLGASFSF